MRLVGLLGGVRVGWVGGCDWCVGWEGVGVRWVGEIGVCVLGGRGRGGVGVSLGDGTALQSTTIPLMPHVILLAGT